jgi:hypothetical protein
VPAERRIREALKFVSEREREALILTHASGFSVTEAAQICGCDFKILKNRVQRGRRRLHKILCMETGDITQMFQSSIEETSKAARMYIDEAGVNVIGPTKDDKIDPPKFAEFLLIAFAPRGRANPMIGDRNEVFTRECVELGRYRAARRYWAETLYSLWPLLWRAVGKAVKWGALIAAFKRLF